MKYTNRAWTKFAIVCIGCAFMISGVAIWTALDLKNKSEDVKTLLVFALFFTALGYVTRWLSVVIEKRWLDPAANKLIEEVRRAELGDDGEDGVYAELKRFLPEDFTVYRNFVIPGKKFDIDAIIVGQKGVVVLEIKNYVNQMLFANDAAYVEKDGKLIAIPSNHDPRNQINSSCAQLVRYFSQHGIGNISIKKAVVFLNKESARVIGDKVSVYVVCGAQNLEKYFSGLLDDQRLTPELCAKINGVLKK